MATRIKLTPTQQAAYTSALIDEVGGDSSKVHTSYAFTDKHRRLVNSEIVKDQEKSWDTPRYASLHWDSKILPKLNDKYKEERLVIAMGTNDHMNLLGVPSYETGTNQSACEIIANKVSVLLEKWDCAQSVVNMTFDTTAANTGHVTAACVSIQLWLGRAVLWSGCRQAYDKPCF